MLKWVVPVRNCAESRILPCYQVNELGCCFMDAGEKGLQKQNPRVLLFMAKAAGCVSIMCVPVPVSPKPHGVLHRVGQWLSGHTVSSFQERSTEPGGSTEVSESRPACPGA